MPFPPFRQDFDSARDAYTARNALGIPATFGIPDAPSDGTLYGRKNAAWSAVPAAGISDAPSDGDRYARQNGAWVGLNATLSGYLPLTGGTLTGNLTISKASPYLFLTKPASGTGCVIWGYTGVNARWGLILGTPTAESGGNAGSDFNLNRYDDAGALLSSPFVIARATGVATFGDGLTAPTRTAGDSTGNAATTAFVTGAIATAAGPKFSTVAVQKFTASGTYTPTAGMKFCIIECVGGGGGGGGASNGSTSQGYWGGGGGSGGYSRKYASAATVGASQTVTVGAFGSGGVGAAAGGAGGTTSVGSLCVANGGAGGNFAASGTVPTPGAGGVAGTGDIFAGGAPGQGGFFNNTNTGILTPAGMGGSSIFGGGGIAAYGGAAAANGNGAGQYGSGGGGGAVYAVVATANGGNGSPGFVIITEFI